MTNGRRNPRTNSPTKVPGIPKPPAGITPGLQKYLSNLSEALEIRLGRKGDPRDRAVTLRELIDSGLANDLANAPYDPNNPGGDFTPGGEDAPDLAVPPTPLGFTAEGGYSIVILGWDLPNYSNHSLTEIWRHTSDVLGDAQLVGIQVGTVYIDPVGESADFYYWVRFVNTEGVAGPFNSNSGTQATTATNTQTLLDELEASIPAVAFASDIEPVGVVNSLPNPSGYTGPRLVVLTTDGKLYRLVNGVWTAAVPTTDLTGTITALQIANDAVTNAAIAVNAIQGDVIAAGAITETKIGQDAVTNAKLANDAVQGDVIAAGAITETKIAADAVTNAKLAIDAVQGDVIAAGAITETKITNDAVTAAKIAANAVTANAIAANAVTANAIAANAVTASEIAAGTITATEIASNAITAAKIAANAVIASKIAADAVTADKIAANTITAGEIAAGAITASELAANAVTAAKIAANAVTASKIAAGNVTATQIAAGAVTAVKIAAGAVTADKIQSNSITALQIAAGAINASELASNSVIADKIAAGAITAGAIAAGAVNASNIISDNIIVANKIAANAITSAKIQAGAVVADKIAAGAVTAAKVSTNEIITSSANIANAVITAAKIDTAAITTAKIDDAAVNTLKIDGNAVTIPVGFSNLSMNTLITTSSTNWTVIGTSPQITWNSTSERPEAVIVNACLNFLAQSSGSSQQGLYLRVVVIGPNNSFIPQTVGVSKGATGLSGFCALNAFVDMSGRSSPHTFRLEARTTTSNYRVGGNGLSVLGAKR